MLICFLNKIVHVFYNFYMGQNIQKEQWLEYSSKDFFKKQLQFYRWRANPLYNNHICKVTFQQEQAVRDKEKLKLFLRNRFSEHNHISINELMSLASEPQKRQIQQLMKFETYAATLDNFCESLNLSQVLYVMQIMLSGYEVLYSKVCRLTISLQTCFLTREGEVKVWFNRDYKSNDIQEDKERASSILVSEMSIIKKILELSQRLSSNSTEFLHFSRQFRSYMERDLLQNWTFPNSIKLINSYLYTYRIKIASDLSSIMKRKIKIPFQQFSSNLNNQSDLSSTLSNHQQQSTGTVLIKDTSKSKQSSKKSLHRPQSHSDYSNKNSMKDCSLKSHSKKNSSIDLKSLHQKAKFVDSSKLIRSDSDFLHYRKEEFIQNKTECIKMDYYQSKIRRERQYAPVQGKNQLGHIVTTTQVSNPRDSSIILLDTSLKKFVSESNKRQGCFMSNPYQKKKTEVNSKKKLQKKVSTVSKYILYRQEQSKQNNKISQDCQKSYLNSTNPNSRCKNNIEDTIKINNTSTMSNSYLLNMSLSNQSKVVHNHSQNNESKLFQQTKIATKRYQFNKSQFYAYKAQNDGIIQDFTHNSRACQTAKTISRLIGGDEVSQHESNGTFMSLEESHCSSEYEGILSKMGRSVNIITSVQSKPIFGLHKKPDNSRNFNNSINY